jgi:two-component system sensor histidine kinase VicK
MKPLVSIRTKLFASFLLIILLSYSGFLCISIGSMDASLRDEAGRVHDAVPDFSATDDSGHSYYISPPNSLTKEELASIRDKNLENILLSATLGIFLSFGIAYLLARKLTAPVRELSLVAERIEHGDFAYRTNVLASDEFGILAASFNRMTEALEERETTIKMKTVDLEVLNRCLRELNEKLEVKVAERTVALEVEKGRLEAILTSMAEGMLVTDQDNRIILFNPAAQKILDVPPHRVAGQNIETVCSLGGFCELVEFLLDMKKGDHLTEGREVHLEINGKKLKVNMSPLLDKTWQFAGVVMSIRDVTLEEEIDRMKTEFISTVSHELKTPLTSIKGSLEIILRRDNGLSDTEKELLAVCERNTDRLIRLIGDILDISRIESGRMEFRFKPESLTRLASEAVEEMTSFAFQRNVSLVESVGDDIPPVFGDRDRLIQVITNLLSNALKFSPEGQVVSVDAAREGHFVRVSVSDRGKSIKKSDRDKLFKKFQKLDSHASGERGGTGLGLAICKEIIEKHHGRISYRSGAGGGNVFSFTVPVYEELHEKGQDSHS